MRLSPASFSLGAALAMSLLSAQGAEPAAATSVSVQIAGEPGPYTFERWKKDWPGCEFQDGIKEGHASVVRRDEANRLRVDYAVGQIGPEKCGVGWRWPLRQGAGSRGQGHESAELRYTMRFSKDFDWVKGGKLPGLCGGPENVSGGRPADGKNGFSARLMWRKEGRGEAYVYHKNQPTQYGESFSFPKEFHFPTEKDIHVRLAVTMNAVGKRDGSVRVWIAIGGEKEVLLVERTDVEWRTVDTFSVDSLYFETFHGGSDESWAPIRKSWAEFGEMSVTALGKP